jgi:hypothetical protein
MIRKEILEALYDEAKYYGLENVEFTDEDVDNFLHLMHKGEDFEDAKKTILTNIKNSLY